MRKWVFWLVIFLLIGYGIARHKSKIVNEKAQEVDVQVQKTDPYREGPQINITKDQIYEGNLLLVDKDHPVPQGGIGSEAVNLFRHMELVKGYGLLDHTIQLSPDLAEKFSTMVRAAEKEGVSHFLISSGYRDDQEQNELYQQMGAAYALPAGYSEHNLGLSIDIGSTQGEMSRAPEGKWLKENAWKYGFILRYPQDKFAITGIKYEPWHFRYVGLPHSAIIHEKNFVLEQYLDFLKEQKTITTTIDHQTYQISYYPVSQSMTIHVPDHRHYEISGNNMDGIIVTIYP